MTKPIRDLKLMIISASALIGKWRFTRQVYHKDSGQRNLVDGVASLTPMNQRIVYYESGVLRVGAQEYTAEREYHWKERAKGVDIYFSDGKFFHGFDWNAPMAEHDCPPDMYKVRYSFGEEEWSSEWQVKGPRKDYVMLTDYIALANS